jgi:chemotaxis protein MotA
MKAATGIGIAIGCAGILLGAQMEGTPMGSLVNVPAVLIIFGGVAGACMAAAGLDAMKLIPTLYKKVLSAEKRNLRRQVSELVSYAERARRDGLLALEEEIEDVEDAYTRKGLQLVVDGTPPDMVREVLEAEIHGMRARHKIGAKLFENAGGFAPTMGVLGAVLGLIAALQNLDDPESLGPAIATAFIATLLGVGAANIVFLPVSQRLKQLSEAEVESRVLVLEGILAIQSGDNPRVIEEKLISFVPPGEREDEEPEEAEGPHLHAVSDDEQLAA